MHHGKVRRAAAEVADEHALGLGNARLVGKRRGDRLVLEMDFLETSQLRGAVQARLSEAVLLGFSREHRRPTHHDARHVLPRDLVSLLFEKAEKKCDQLLERERLVVDDSLGERAIGQDGFDRLKKTAAHLVLHVADFRGVADQRRIAAKRVGKIHERRLDACDARIADLTTPLHIPDRDG